VPGKYEKDEELLEKIEAWVLEEVNTSTNTCPKSKIQQHWQL
jgi:hypothetical protein